MKLQYKVGDATQPEWSHENWILNGCNNLGLWGAGFVLALNKTFGDKPREHYESFIDDGAILGDIQLCRVNKNTCVANMITQKWCGSENYFGQEIPMPPARLEAIEECLWRVRFIAEEHYMQLGYYPTIASVKVGCGLGGLRWSDVEKLYIKVFQGTLIPVTIYTLS